MKGLLTMKKTVVCLVVVSIFLVSVAIAYSDDQLIDIVYLKDDTVLEGLIVEQAAGVSVKLATADRIVYTLSNQEIDRVVKKKTKEPIPFSYRDAVLLKDGVMFRGTIVEQRPEVNIVLQTENELQLTFPTEDIWKILKEKRVAGKVVDKDEKRSRNERERLKISLQIELVRDEIRKQEERQRSSGEQAEGELEGEIDRLKEQMEDLEQTEEQIEFDSVTERRIEERERLEELQLEIEELLEELTEMLEECDNRGRTSDRGEKVDSLSRIWKLQTDSYFHPENRILSLQPLSGFAENVEEITDQLSESLGEVVHQTIYKIPTQEEIDALKEQQFAYSSLTQILGTSRWKVSSTRGMMRGMAELLPVEDRVFLYETHKQRGAVPFALLNIIPFACVGSLAQGDGWGAAIGILQSTTLIPIGVLLIIDDAAGKGYDTPLSPGYFPGDLGAGFWGGAAIVIASYAFNIIEPFWYISRMTKRLQNRLLLDEETIRDVKREERRAALNPPSLKLVPGRERELDLQLDLVSLSY